MYNYDMYDDEIDDRDYEDDGGDDDEFGSYPSLDDDDF